MNYEKYLNQEVENGQLGRGHIVSFDNEYIVIQYKSEKKTYKPDLAFKNKAISLVDEVLNQEINQHYLEVAKKTSQEEEKINKINKQVIKKNINAYALFEKIADKYEVLKSLFGEDVYYPPYHEFRKKYPFVAKSFDRRNKWWLPH